MISSLILVMIIKNSTFESSLDLCLISDLIFKLSTMLSKDPPHISIVSLISPTMTISTSSLIILVYLVSRSITQLLGGL